MWIDLNASETAPFAQKYDVCVCGSGPAGMAVVQKLMTMRKDARILLLEAGGLGPTPESQDVYRGKSIGALEYWGVESCRLRYFGGTSNHWAGRCGVFDPIDFENRSVWSLPGWPISYGDAYGHLDEALAFLDLAPGAVDRGQIENWRSERYAPAGAALSPPTRVGEKFRPALEAAPNVDVAINANVTDILFEDDGGRAARVKVEDYGGRDFEVAADYFVIAFGALENARFLLNARARGEAGLGNQNDMVGRCFMEHFDVRLGRFVSTNDAFWRRAGRMELNPSAALMNAARIGNAVVALNPSGKQSFYGRLAPLRRTRRNLTCAYEPLLKMARAKQVVICPGDGVATTILEQTPNMASRVTLDGGEEDRFGKRRLNLDWRISDQDRTTIVRTAQEIGKALAIQGVARFRIASDVLSGDMDLGMHCHQMGTTRMSRDPKYGVVDGDSKIHGLENVYLGGSSVFPTGGGVNPTLTIVALSLRLGAHLAGRLGAH